MEITIAQLNQLGAQLVHNPQLLTYVQRQHRVHTDALATAADITITDVTVHAAGGGPWNADELEASVSLVGRDAVPYQLEVGSLVRIVGQEALLVEDADEV
jgi:hypothetical protein